jgi:uncharacterized protein YaaW (UPF0174 family)
VLKLLRHNKHLTIKATDKNLGPAIMETKVYINQVFTEHLLTRDYKQLSTTEAKNILDKVKNTLIKLIEDNQNNLSKAELTYFKRNMNSYHRIQFFYGLPKVHKTPTTLRPVVSYSSSLSAVFSLQLAGTAMGTPVACSYATVSFGHYENTTILPQYVCM